MPTWRAFLARHSLVAGVILMFALTWPIDLANSGLLPFQLPFVLYLFLGWGFIVASLAMTWLTQGRPGVVTLLKRYLIWRVGGRWYVVAFLLFPAIFLASIALYAAWTGEPVDLSASMAGQFFGSPTNWPLFIIPFLFYEAIANGEEMGWRGYVLPRLQAGHSALVASLILGVIWGLWHLPKFLGPASDGSFALMIVKALGDAVLYSWLYNNTRGSLLLVTIFHASGNTAAFFLPLSAAGNGPLIIATALINLAALAVTVLAGPAKLTRTAEKQVVEIRLPPVGSSAPVQG